MRNIDKLIDRLQRPACEICPSQANCEDIDESGCLFREAAAALKDQRGRIRHLEKEVSDRSKAAFRLGQLDMRETASSMLREAANGTYGITRAAVSIAADMVAELEVRDDT